MLAVTTARLLTKMPEFPTNLRGMTGRRGTTLKLGMALKRGTTATRPSGGVVRVGLREVRRSASFLCFSGSVFVGVEGRVAAAHDAAALLVLEALLAGQAFQSGALGALAGDGY